MPYRVVINSDAGRTAFMERCMMQHANDVAAETPVMTEETAAAMTTLLPAWKQRLQMRGKETAERMPAVAAKDEAKTLCAMWISHFFQVLHLWIKRELHDEGILKFYTTEVLTNSIPAMTRDDDVLLWGGRLIDGEARRVAAGGTAMAFPSAAQFSPIYADFKTKLQAAQKEKGEVTEAESGVVLMRVQVDALIADAVAELEFFLRKEPPTLQRNRMRLYGLKFAYRPGEPEEEEPPPVPEG